ncbi:hypothetical protein [Blautia producta]|uniref:hypothetical protein n=1 Tax=Blautia producta TaxID=33035 RepID=UPI0031B63196
MQTVNDFMETDLGNISPNPRGDYSGTATYEYLDLVVYQGGSYLCVAELGSTVTGKSPVPGKTTAEWQVITLPGDLTPEYVKMHDTVVNKSEQVTADRQTVEESLRNVQSIQLDVEQLHQDTRTAAEEAENSKDSAAGYAQAADSSRQAAATSEANVNAQVTGFEEHVADKTGDAEAAITQARQRAVQVVEDATKPALAAKTAAETAQGKAEAAQTAAETARADAQSAKTAAETARTGAETARTAAETAQGKAETAQASTEQTAAEIASDREQIHTNRDNVAQLQRNSAGAITRSAEGSFITLEDAADEMGFRRIEIEGETEQRTTTGAQLFDFDVWKGAECIRGTAVYSNNGMVLTATENDAYTDHTASAARIKVEPNTTYTFSWEHSGASGYVYIFSNGANVLASPVNTSKKSTFTTREDTTFISFRVGVNAKGGVASYSNIMCNTGEAVIPWEPYSGAMPSPSPGWSQDLQNVGVPNEAGKYKVKITVCEKNLLDMTGAKGGTSAGITTVVNPDGTLTSNGTGTGGPVAIWLLGGYRPVTTDNVLFTLQAGKTYYISDVVLYMGTDRTAQNKLFVDPAKYPEGFKVTGVRHAQIDSGTVLTNKVYHPRVILGDTDTGWEPYRGHTATITSDRPLTQWDKLTCRDGVWGWAYGSNTVVYDGSEDEAWKWQGLNGHGIVNLQINLSGAVSNFDSPNRCSHLPYQTTGIAATTEPGFFISDSTDNSILYIRVPNADVWDVPSFRRWLAKYVITVQYQTDTETWVPLSPEEQAAMNALCTYAGTTHIWTDDPLHPVISLDYTLDTEGYIRNVVVKNLQLDIAEQITDLQAQIDQLTINNNL